MPRVNLTRDEGQERAKKQSRMIRMKCAERDIPSQAALARKIGMNESTMSTKMNTGGWTVADVRLLNRHLRFSADEVMQFISA